MRVVTCRGTSHNSQVSRHGGKLPRTYTGYWSGQRRTQNDVKCDEHMPSCRAASNSNSCSGSTSALARHLLQLPAFTLRHFMTNSPALQRCTGKLSPGFCSTTVSTSTYSVPQFIKKCSYAPGLETFFEACMCDLTWLTIMCHKSLLCVWRQQSTLSSTSDFPDL